jgi:DNA-directed RNA polymerase subunit M/transcription elongation factor TFIIS/outer membrane biosynthesis protein TonB
MHGIIFISTSSKKKSYDSCHFYKAGSILYYKIEHTLSKDARIEQRTQRMSIIYGLLLTAKGDIKRIKVKELKDTDPLTTESLQTILKKKTPVSELGTYPFGDLKLTLFGYKTGKTGTENKHELPAPLNSEKIFSDILLIASKKRDSWKTPINFSPDQYEKFYQSAFGEEEEEDNEDEEDDEEDEEDEEKVSEDEGEDEEDDDHKISNKKKKAEDEGIPEDEEDKEAEEESEEEEEDEEGDEEEEEEEDDIMGMGDGDGDCEEEEERVPTKSRTSSKKKPAKGNLTVTQNTGRARQQILATQPGFQEISSVGDIPDTKTKEYRLRTHVLQQIDRLLGEHFDESMQKELEKIIFQSALTDADTKLVVKHFDNKLFELCYLNSSRRFLSNLAPSSYVKNDHLLQKLLQGDLTLEHISSMNVMDFAPSMYVEMRERQSLREQQQLEGNKAMATDMFKCGRCHKKETTFYELQTRSADEPMTKFITCVNCGNHWRM